MGSGKERGSGSKEWFMEEARKEDLEGSGSAERAWG